MAIKNRIEFEVGYSVDRSTLSDITKSLKQIQDEVTKASTNGTLTKELEDASKAAKKLESILNDSWNNKLNQLDLSKMSNEIKKSYGGMEQLKNSLSTSGDVGVNAYNKLATSILNTNLQLTKSNKLLDDMALTMSNTVKWAVTSSIVNNISGAISKAWGYTKSLDESLNNIRIVTGKSSEEMAKFAKNANDAAKALGSSTTDFTDASLIYYQQGQI